MEDQYKTKDQLINELLGLRERVDKLKKLEKERKNAEALYFTRFPIDSAADTMVCVDHNARFIDVNDAFCRSVGYSREELLSMTVHDIDPDYSDEVWPEFWKRLKQSGSLTFESCHRTRDGKVFPLEITANFFEYNGKEYHCGFARDITERKKAEEALKQTEDQLRQSQKMEAIGRLSGGIAHDFNNLLTVIKGYSQLTLMGLKEGDPLKRNIEEIQRSSDRAANLTRQLLAFSRRQILETKVLDLNSIIKDVDEMLHRIIGEDIELVTLLGGDLGRVKTDRGEIEQVLMNLGVNARDAMPNGGILTIETANVILDDEYACTHIDVKPGQYVMLSVSDTGYGMIPEVRERVFEPFFTTKEKGQGTGLGLSTVYGIVKQSGGNICIHSEPGHGTTFKIYLPQVDEPLDELGESPRIDGIPRGNETILIVEDDEAVRKLAVRVLEKQGYTVLEANQEYEALNFCKERKEPVHLILTDVVMPGMNGRQLIECLKEVRQDFKVLYMSGYTDDAIVHHGVLEMGVDFIRKPFTFEGLARRVREVLNK